MFMQETHIHRFSQEFTKQDADTVIQFDAFASLEADGPLKADFHLEIWSGVARVGHRVIRMEVDHNNCLPFAYQHLFLSIGAGTYEARLGVETGVGVKVLGTGAAPIFRVREIRR